MSTAGKKEVCEGLRLALRSRDLESDFFVLYDATQEGVPRAVVREVVSTAVWCYFTEMLLSDIDALTTTVGDGSADADLSADRCDVGLACAESFYATLVESACLVLGRSFCLVNPRDPERRRAALLQRRRPALLLTDEGVAAILMRARDAASAAEKEGPRAVRPESLVASVEDSAVAYFIFTSGSTGSPKCVRVSRQNLYTYVTSFAYASSGLGADGQTSLSGIRTLCLSTPFFDPSIGDMAATLFNRRPRKSREEGKGGGADALLACVPAGSLVNGDLSLLVLAAQPTHVVSTPAVWRTVHTPSRETFRAACPGMRLFLGGERMPQRVVDDWADIVALYNIYGLTEATVYQSVVRVMPGTAVSDIPCALEDTSPSAVSSGVVLRLERDSEDGRDLRVAITTTGEEGEIVLEGLQVCLGYADALPTEQSGFVRGGAGTSRRFRTGDTGVWKLLPSGERALYLRGRRDWQVKINGQRTGLEEVEQSVAQVFSAAVRECCCCSLTKEPLARDGPTAAEEPSMTLGIACVLSPCVCDGTRLRDMTSPLGDAFKALLSLHLPSHMVPTMWLFLPETDSLPRTSTGKTDRAAVRKDLLTTHQNRIDQGRSSDAIVATPGEDALTFLIRKVWCRFFGVTDIALSANFFFMGGDSLGALKLTRAVLLAVQSGSDSGIDALGHMPAPYQPCVLLRNPVFGAYVTAVREEMNVAGIQVPEFPDQDYPTGRLTAGTQESARQRKAAADLNEPNPHERLVDVVATGCVPLARLFLSHGIYDVDGGNTRRRRCITPLHVAVRLPAKASTLSSSPLCVSMVELLLQYGAKPTCVTADGVTPLHLAASVGGAAKSTGERVGEAEATSETDAEPLRTLLSHSSVSYALHCRDYRQQSLLHFAAREGREDCVRLLLEQYGADLRVRDKWQRTPVHWAALNRHTGVLVIMAAHVESGPLSAAVTAEANRGTSADECATTKKKRPRQKTDPVGGEARATLAMDGGVRCATPESPTPSRFARLAKKKTYLAYETLEQIAARVAPGDAEMERLVAVLSPVVESE